ncbi:MAG TPA: cytochrome c [Bryobacteraceae bacterium]|nr:cytochrome c [Bryobacteraceae bacterium]
MNSTNTMAGVVATLIFLTAQPATAQSQGAAKLHTGKDIFEAGCAGCHGSDGKGAPQSAIGFEKPETFPDFTRCDQTTPEDNVAWKSVIRDGGPSRGFSQIMPSFREALTSEQMDQVIDYLRGFCREKGWPRGELNLPRALATEKAYPEDEVVITTTANVRGTPAVSNEIVHEQRFGEKNQIEVSVPVDFQRPERGVWYGGPGDIGLGLKRVLFSSLHTGSILSVQGEAIFPTGNVAHGLGKGTTTFETFAAYGQLLPWKSFLQVQGGADLPHDTSKSPQSVFFRTALGKSFNQNDGLGRLWSPMVEFLADRTLETGARTDWDVMPEFQVTLSKRQHVRADIGLRIPATNTAGRPVQVMFYLLWDWQDGKLLEGWK